MSWIKRNLYFVIGGVVSVALLGASAWYLWSKMQLNKQKLAEFEQAYADLDRLSKLNPNPGNDKVDNIKNAQDQQEQVTKLVNKARSFFVPIPSIPPSTNASDYDFVIALRGTMSQLQNEAVDDSVTLPQAGYYFSFEAERTLARFSTNALAQLTVQLGEVKAISDVLFNAKVNALDNLKRERVSDDDLRGPQSDFLDDHSVTNDLAIITPYEVTFHCFSTELGNAISGFANSSNGLLISAINIEPGAAASANASNPNNLEGGYVPPPPPVQAPTALPPELQGAAGYGPPTRTATPLPTPVYVPTVTTPSTRRGGLPVVVNEKQLKVTMRINVVKLLPPQK